MKRRKAMPASFPFARNVHIPRMNRLLPAFLCLLSLLAARAAEAPAIQDYAAFTVERPAPGSGWTLRPEDQTPTEALIQRDPWAPGVRAHVFASSKIASLPTDDTQNEALLALLKIQHGSTLKGGKPPAFTSEAGEFQGRPAAFFRSVVTFDARMAGGTEVRAITRGVYARVPGKPRGLTMILYVETLPVGTAEKATDAEARAFLEKVKLK